MSIEAMRWAYGQSRGLNSTSKFVLTTLADYANDDNCAYPSHQTLASRTLLDPKTVTLSLDRLVRHGFIKDTGERKGRTGRVKVYELNPVTHPISDGLNTTKNGAIKPPNVAETGGVKSSSNDPSNPTKNGVSESHQKRITEPPVRNHKKEKRNQLSKFIDFLIDDPRFDGLDVEGEVARAVEWCKKKNRAVTERFLEHWLLHAEQPLEEDEEEVGSLTCEDYYSWEGWTEDRRRALLELWPNAAQPPQRWEKISRDIKELIEARVKEGWPA